MSDFVYNIAKGRVAEFVQRVNNADPAQAALVVVGIAVAGEVTQPVQQDATTLAAVLSGGTTEVINAGYTRKVLRAADISAYNHAPNNTANTNWCDLPDITWVTVAAAGGEFGSLVVCYRSVDTAADSAIVPLTHHTFAVAPDGTNIVAQIATTGFFVAS